MRQLEPRDRAVFVVLLTIWIACLAGVIRSQVAGGGFLQLRVLTPAADANPVLLGYNPSASPNNPLAAADLRPGDELIRLGSQELRGFDEGAIMGLSLELSAAASSGGSDSLSLPLVAARAGVPFETAVPLEPTSTRLHWLVSSLSYAGVALFLLLRGRPTPTVRSFFPFAMCIAILCCFFPTNIAEQRVWRVIAVVGVACTFPLAFRFFMFFPDDRAPSGWLRRAWPWVFALAPPATLLLGPEAYAAYEWPIVAASSSIAVVAMLAHVTGKFRRAGPIERRQMKWVVLGVFCAASPMAASLLVSAAGLAIGWPTYGAFWFLSFLPLSLLISVVRFNLFDVDRILSATASYNILVALLGAGALVVVPRVAVAVSGVAGVDPGTSQIVLSLALVAAVIPAQRRLRPQIDRVFFKERFALDHGIAELLPTLSACTNARELTERAGAGLSRLLQPEACVVYAGVEASYAPVFVEGRAAPPVFASTSPLVVLLAERRAPLSLSAAGRRPDEAPLGPFDRAALETLQAEVVVPVRRNDALAGFLCFGPKRSGDVYTSTDLSLLAAVAEKVSTELRRFDQEETVREARAMQRSLRRYVPGAVAEQLASGADLASGEREVTVLFVDIRGYTGFSEGRSAEDIFSTVNRYTKTVSQIVQKHSGSVVEFNGDGMMAVFGAPRELAHKERAAVKAGCEVVEAVGALPVEDADGGRTKLSVGVGIATGDAFVGNIQAVDRMIWSAIGNTTNLAARLQSLTRELDASLVIDGGTWEGAQPAAAGFEKRPDVPIRGRRETQDVYVLPMPAPGPAATCSGSESFLDP